jgi:hypothetical protein
VLKHRLRGSLFRTTILSFLVLSMAATVAASDSRRLRTDLRGTNENPDADPDGRGRATVRIDVEAGEVCFDVSFERTGTPNQGHIHVGNADQNGLVVVPFFNIHQGTPAAVADPRHDQMERRNRLSDCVPADREILEAIEANPSGYYVNLHNARFPGGAIRGQLGSPGGDDDD